MNGAIAARISEYILAEYLPGEDPAALTPQTPLITTAVLDSIATLRVVAFLEEQFGVRIEAHEADVENLNTIADMVRLVESKTVGRA